MGEIIHELKMYMTGTEFRKALQISGEKEIACQLLAQGEYNINYLCKHPNTGESFVLRINTGSQMHLENQIEYEYSALKNLENSGRTPKVFWRDGSKKNIKYGVLAMEYLEGRALDYDTDLDLAAECLADIHSTELSADTILLEPSNPLQAILDECNEMVKIYYECDTADEGKKIRLKRMLEEGQEKVNKAAKMTYPRCCINTELNSGNFLINGKGKPNYLVDWEKPLLGDPAQDLGHFLAPTTTFWKTDVILPEEKITEFIEKYEKAVDDRIVLGNLKERVDIFIPITCLRGLTWCAMAWVEYQKQGRLIQNEFTRKKLDEYLSDRFLSLIEERYYPVWR